jgi:transposase InsO family protein
VICESVAAGDCSIRSGCQALDVSESGYFDWLRRQEQGPCAREVADERLTKQIVVIHVESGEAYGSPRVHAALRHSGEKCSKHRVARLMHKANIRSRRTGKARRIQTTDSNHALLVARNLLAREFTAPASDKKWVADATYIPTEKGWLFLAVILDLFSRKVVGWSAATRFNRELVCQALYNALEVRKPPDLLHSDRGVQYASDAYQEMLTQAGIHCSMSRKGDCYDNAVVESFFASLKSEIAMPRDGFANPDQARRALFAYIESFYNTRRLHSSLGYLSPVAFEAKKQQLLEKGFA